MRPLQHGPEGLYPVGVRLAADVRGNGVTDRLMLAFDAFVGRRIIGVDRGVFLGVVFDEILQRLGIGLGDDFGADLIGRPILHADNGGFTYRATARSRQFLAPCISSCSATCRPHRFHRLLPGHQTAHRHLRPRLRGCGAAWTTP